MARRRLFSDEHWAGLFALPADERDVVRHCTLTPDDLALIGAKRSAHNRLGYALLLCALRHPGRALDVGEVPPVPMVAYVAGQLGVDPATLAAYAGRPQTRREQLGELMRRGGLRSFGRAEARALVAWLIPNPDDPCRGELTVVGWRDVSLGFGGSSERGGAGPALPGGPVPDRAVAPPHHLAVEPGPG